MTTPKTTMSFHEAIDLMVSGQRITAEDWPNGSFAKFVLLDGHQKLMLHKPNQEFKYYPWTITVNDVQKDDYILYRAN